MEMLEKVEKLRERANVSYEEAKEALYACDGDLLDAIVMLEQDGKVKKPEKSTYSTSYEKQDKFVSVEETVKSQKTSDNVFHAIRKAIRAGIDKCRGNFFCVKKDGSEKFRIPVLLFIILLAMGWQVALPAMVIMLFFGFQFSFTGKGGLEKVNDIMNKASGLAEQVRGDFTDAVDHMTEEQPESGFQADAGRKEAEEPKETAEDKAAML